VAGRIRSIKPEILEDEKTASLPHLEWRLFVSLFLIADDYGNLRGDPAYVRGQVMWAVDETRDSIANALDGLARVSLLSPYTVRDQSYFHIAGWDKHQKVDKPGKPRMPGPDEATPELIQADANDSRDPRETPAEPRETLAPDLRSGPPITDHDRDLRARTILPPVKTWGLQSPEEIAKARTIGDLAQATWRRISDARMEQAKALKLEGVIALPVIHPGKQPASFDELRARIREEGEAAREVCDHVVKALVEQARETKSVDWLSEKAFLEGSWRTARASVLKQKRRAIERAPPPETVGERAGAEDLVEAWKSLGISKETA